MLCAVALNIFTGMMTTGFIRTDLKHYKK